MEQDILLQIQSLPEDVREAMLADVTAEVIRRKRIKQDTQRLAFRGAAKRIQTEDCEELVISGPARTGKSLAALKKMHDLLSAFPYARALIVRKTRASLTETGLQTFEDVVLSPTSPLLSGPQRRNRSVYIYPNKSRMVIGGMDKASRIMSSEFDIIFVQEATELEEAEWEALSTRLSGSALPYQQLLADCNPSFPQHWLKRREKENRLKMFYSYHKDNPIFYDNDGNMTERGVRYLSRLEQLTGVRKDRLYHGLWVAAEGAIYPEWKDKRNLCDKFSPPADWRRIMSVDFGFVNPLVVQCWAIDNDNRMYMYREIYETELLVEDATRMIKNFPDLHLFEAIICDHDAEDRATLEKHLGRDTTPAEKAVSVGIQEVQSRIKGNEGKALSQIVLMRDVLVRPDMMLAEVGKPYRTQDEIPGYTWMPDQKEMPAKVDDHGCDAMRYAAMYESSFGNADDWVIKPR